MKGSGRIGQGILIISFMLLFVQSHGQFQFDYFKLALQWTPTTCAVSTCNQTKFSQFPQEFTIHGLWPSTYAYPQPNWCQPRLLYDTNNTQFIPLKNQLNANWPDMIKPTNDIFWGHEFEKHGTCMTSNQADYFITTLNLKSQLIPNVKAAIGYAPSRMTRNIQDFMTSLIRAYRFQPVIVCDALAEVWLCFDNNRRLRNCPRPWKINCNTFISLLA